jgi:hypothetical protein
MPVPPARLAYRLAGGAAATALYTAKNLSDGKQTALQTAPRHGRDKDIGARQQGSPPHRGAVFP